uniref:39S ribosomal protein L27, mitochondrial n=1 Tax=Ditylenchus dipsaci TaxID=166011 RepID=A0A915EK30_9BILA
MNSIIARCGCTTRHLIIPVNSANQFLPFVSSKRTKFGPSANTPFIGVYRKDGDIVCKDDLLIVQTKMNYHPGANVRYQAEFGKQHYLMADCDGTVVVTREKAEPDPELDLMQKEYGFRNFENIYKLHYNIVPRKMSQTFKLVDVV